MKRNIILLAASTLTLFIIGACKSGGGEVMPDSATFPDALTTSEGIVILQKAIKSHDPHRIAGQFSYPIQREYPLKDIPDSATMVKYYRTIIDDSLENILINTPQSEWIATGWRGWSPTEDGRSIWWDGKIYDVPYHSKKERHIKEKLIAQDLATLEPDLRNGWRPYYCLISPDSHTIYRIDIAEGEEEGDSAMLRLMAFPLKVSKGMHPKMQLKGRMTVEGSEGNRILHFRSDNFYADYVMDISDDSAPRIIFVAPDDTTAYVVRPTYWLDLVTDSVGM